MIGLCNILIAISTVYKSFVPVCDATVFGYKRTSATIGDFIFIYKIT